MSYDVTDLERRLANLIRMAMVVEVDLQQARVRLSFMNNTSAWVPWVTQRAAGVRTWSPPQVGELLLVLAPQGETEQAVCLPALYQAGFPAPGSEAHEHITLYEDGALVGYNDDTHTLSATLPDGATLKLVSPGGMTLTGDLTVNGAVTHNGNTTHKGTTHSTGAITCDADVSDVHGTLQANRDVFNSHTHIGDSGGMTGMPNQKQP